MRKIPDSAYNPQRSTEWADWVESTEAQRSREKEIYPLIRQWIQSLRPGTVADIGCGQGVISEQVDQTVRYVGVDASPHLIRRAQERYASERRTFMVGDAYELPLESQSVDGVLSVWVWSHLDNLPKAAQEMARILKPGGGWLIINAHPATYEARKRFYASYEMVGDVLVGDFDLGHGKILSSGTLYFHAQEEIEQALANAGLEVRQVTSLGYTAVYPPGLYIALNGVRGAKGMLSGANKELQS